MNAIACTRCGTFLPPEQEVPEGQRALCASCGGGKSQEELKEAKAARWVKGLGICSLGHGVLLACLLAFYCLMLWFSFHEVPPPDAVDTGPDLFLYWVMGFLALFVMIPMIGQSVAGAMLLRRRPGASRYAKVFSVWGLPVALSILFAPTSIILVIASFMVLRDEDVRAHIDTWT